MLGHLLVLAVFLALALFVAVPRITSRAGVPRQLAFETVPDAALSEVQAAHFARLDQTLRGLQYAPVFNIRVSNLMGANLSRFYTSATDPALMLTSLLRVRVKSGSSHNLDYVEIITRYTDGTVLTTSNSPARSVFDRPAQRVHQRFPGLGAAALKERHDRAAAGLLPRDPLWVRGDEILARWQESHRQWYEHQVQQGLLAYDAASDRYAPSRRTALRGIADYLNPVAATAPPHRIAAGALTSAALLGLGTFAAAVPSSALVKWVEGVTGLSRAGAVALALWMPFTLAGVAIGLTFGHRHFVWALVLGGIPVAVLAGSLEVQPFAALVWLAFVAERVARWLNRRRRLV